jgi:deazaflavin-dependent oxidoreductase (nitroreductase family)
MRIPDRLFTIINPTVRLLLQSPLHRFWSRSLMLITFTGRRTGKVYTTPVRYLKAGESVWAFTSVENIWWKNLRGGAAVRLCIEGKERACRAVAVADDPEAIRNALAEFLAHFPQDAPYYDIGLSSDGHPLEADLQRAARRTAWVRVYPQ